MRASLTFALFFAATACADPRGGQAPPPEPLPGRAEGPSKAAKSGGKAKAKSGAKAETTPDPSAQRFGMAFNNTNGLARTAHGALHPEQRPWAPAMVPWRATDDGPVTDDVVDWYARFAAGRPGALVVEATGIRDVPSGPLLRIGDDRFIPGLTRLAAAVRAASGGHTRLFIQLIDFLAVKRRPPPGKLFARFLAVGAGARDEPRPAHWRPTRLGKGNEAARRAGRGPGC